MICVPFVNYSRLKAFTLIECLLALSVLLIVSCNVIPFSERLLSKHKLHRDVWAIRHMIKQLRLLAISRGETMLLCPRGKQNKCGQDWSQGLLAVAQASQQVLMRISFSKGAHIDWHGFHSDRFIALKPTADQSGQAGHFVYQYHGQQAKIFINRVGRTRLES